jgi:hypothetical protein
MVTEVCNFSSLRVRGRRKEKSKRGKRKKQKKLDLRKRVKKSKNNTQKKRTNPRGKKRKETKRRELNSLTFQTHLSFTLYTHTHNKKTL